MSAASAGRRSAMRRGAALMLGIAAAAAGVVAALFMWQAPSVPITAGAIVVHVLAALMARAAARMNGATECEHDLVLILALVAPAFGPGLAWTMCLARAPGSERNAHAAFEAQASSGAMAQSPELERELLVRSHAQVLRHGSLEEKRNLLRQLARIGERRYLLLLRHFLRDAEPELRLCAYAELARECQQREERIGELRAHSEAIDPGDPAALAAARAELAEANRAYGTSGLLDADMAQYWLEQACRLAETALTVDPTCRAAQCALALARAELGEPELAWTLVADWPDDVEPTHDLARAELAFRRRDRGVCMAVAARLEARGHRLPVWLAETVGRHAGESDEALAQPVATAADAQEQGEAALQGSAAT